MGEEVSKDKTLLKHLSEDFGYVNPANWVRAVYSFSGKVTWAVNDIATMQAIYEEMDAGRSMQEAIENVGKHIPNYMSSLQIFSYSYVKRQEKYSRKKKQGKIRKTLAPRRFCRFCFEFGERQRRKRIEIIWK